MKLVPMAEEHLEKLVELEQICFSDPWSRASLEEELENSVAVFFTAMEGEEILGYAGMHCVLGECYLDNIAVFPDHRRKGVGKALLLGMEEEAKQRQGEFITLEVRVSNRGAIMLYESLGYEKVGRRKNYYGKPREDALIYTKYFSTEKAEAAY